MLLRKIACVSDLSDVIPSHQAKVPDKRSFPYNSKLSHFIAQWYTWNCTKLSFREFWDWCFWQSSCFKIFHISHPTSLLSSNFHLQRRGLSSWTEQRGLPGLPGLQSLQCIAFPLAILRQLIEFGQVSSIVFGTKKIGCILLYSKRMVIRRNSRTQVYQQGGQQFFCGFGPLLQSSKAASCVIQVAWY